MEKRGLSTTGEDVWYVSPGVPHTLSGMGKERPIHESGMYGTCYIVHCTLCGMEESGPFTICVVREQLFAICIEK